MILFGCLNFREWKKKAAGIRLPVLGSLAPFILAFAVPTVLAQDVVVVPHDETGRLLEQPPALTGERFRLEVRDKFGKPLDDTELEPYGAVIGNQPFKPVTKAGVFSLPKGTGPTLDYTLLKAITDDDRRTLLKEYFDTEKSRHRKLVALFDRLKASLKQYVELGDLGKDFENPETYTCTSGVAKCCAEASEPFIDFYGKLMTKLKADDARAARLQAELRGAIESTKAGPSEAKTILKAVLSLEEFRRGLADLLKAFTQEAREVSNPVQEGRVGRNGLLRVPAPLSR